MSMTKKKPPWNKIQSEYETGDISYAKLAKKYKVSEKTLEARARREEWKKGKAEIKGKVREKIREKSIKKAIDRNTRHINIIDRVLDLCEKMLSDEQIKKGVDMLGNVFETDIISHSKVAKVMEVIEKAQKGHRLAEGILDEKDKQNLEISKQKVGMNESDDDLQTGVVVIPEINMSLMDNAIIEEQKIIDTGQTLEVGQ